MKLGSALSPKTVIFLLLEQPYWLNKRYIELGNKNSYSQDVLDHFPGEGTGIPSPVQSSQGWTSSPIPVQNLRVLVCTGGIVLPVLPSPVHMSIILNKTKTHKSKGTNCRNRTTSLISIANRSLANRRKIVSCLARSTAAAPLRIPIPIFFPWPPATQLSPNHDRHLLPQSIIAWEGPGRNVSWHGGI